MAIQPISAPNGTTPTGIDFGHVLQNLKLAATTAPDSAYTVPRFDEEDPEDRKRRINFRRAEKSFGEVVQRSSQPGEDGPLFTPRQIEERERDEDEEEEALVVEDPFSLPEARDVNPAAPAAPPSYNITAATVVNPDAAPSLGREMQAGAISKTRGEGGFPMEVRLPVDGTGTTTDLGSLFPEGVGTNPGTGTNQWDDKMVAAGQAQLQYSDRLRKILDEG